MGATELREGWRTLLESRGITCPDGRPLYAYRFARSEFDRVGELLRQHGASALGDRHGAALIVSRIAEWFRRERSGGHWDWIRPLRAIGLEYGPSAHVRYSDVECMVTAGLRTWGRPIPHGGERLLAVVREAGFPVASVREDPRISSWLKNAVLSVERGFSVRDAVGAEAWRVSDRLAQALFEPACELCANIVELRAALPPGIGSTDPVEYLDQSRPKWRVELPFDVECGDIRALVEQIVRFRGESSSALSVRRHFIRSGEEWESRATLTLTGGIDRKRLPTSVANALMDPRRLRIFPRPPLCDELIAIAAIESYESGGIFEHELRPLVSKFDARLDLESEARLSLQSGSSTVAEFVAAGGEAMHGPVIALEIDQVDEAESPTTLRVLGASPVRTSRSALALAIDEEHFPSVTFSNGYTDLGYCSAADRRIVQFSGLATLCHEGTRWNWRTAADNGVDERIILVGNLLKGVHESVFRGLPVVWIERDGKLSAANRHELFFRPRGRGAWLAVEKCAPWGSVDLAVISSGELRFSANALIVPPDFEVVLEQKKREVRVNGLGSGILAAQGAANLVVRREADSAVVQLGRATKTPTITLRPRWTAELAVTITDPNSELYLVDASGDLVESHSTLSVDDLAGMRILTSREVPMSLELRATDTPVLTITRFIDGEVPLSSFTNSIKQLLGCSESLDARVELSAHGGTRRIAAVRWYAQDVDPFDVPKEGAFAVLAATHGLDMQAIAIGCPSAGVAAVEAPASQAAMRGKLSSTLPSGPWLIYGRRRNGARIRPKIVSAVTPTAMHRSALQSALAVDDLAERRAAFLQLYSDLAQVSSQDTRTIIDLLLTARREGLPLSSIDALKFLCRAPGLAVRLLASCETFDERASVLELQRDLPFLWCATSIEVWWKTFSDRLDLALRQAADFGIDTAIAYRRMLVALDEIVGLRPELMGHAKAVFLMNISRSMAQEGRAVDGAPLPFLRTTSAPRFEIDRMVSRHDDRNPPPRGMLGEQAKATQQGHWSAYDKMFADMIAVPFAIADHVAGRSALSDRELKRCRDVWLYDPEYFEAIVPACVDRAVRGVKSTGVTIA